MSLFGSIRRLAHGCPPGWKLSRVASFAADPAVERHVRACRSCAGEIDALRELVARAREALPAPGPTSEANRDVISRHRLASASTTRAGGRRAFKLWFGAAALAAVTIGVFVWTANRPPQSRPQAQLVPQDARASLVSVRAIGQARFSRIQAPPDELLRLDNGSIELQVVPLGRRERFRVLTGDAEIEVRGTRFRVVALDRELMAVHVWEGRVEVRPFGGGVAVLDPGDEWERSPPADAPVAGPSAPEPGAARHGGKTVARLTKRTGEATPTSLRSSIARSSLGTRSRDGQPGSGPFDRAWALLRGGNPQAAARAFADVEILARGSPLEEDALYWRAVATARSKDSGAAALFAEFLGRFPSSSRAGEVAVALGWLRLEEGGPQEAKHLFTKALSDPSPQVSASAREGLRRIAE